MACSPRCRTRSLAPSIPHRGQTLRNCRDATCNTRRPLGPGHAPSSAAVSHSIPAAGHVTCLQSTVGVHAPNHGVLRHSRKLFQSSHREEIARCFVSPLHHLGLLLFESNSRCQSQKPSCNARCMLPPVSVQSDQRRDWAKGRGGASKKVSEAAGAVQSRAAEIVRSLPVMFTKHIGPQIS